MTNGHIYQILKPRRVFYKESNNQQLLVPDANLRVNVDRVARGRESLAERNILGVHFDQGVTLGSVLIDSKPGLLQIYTSHRYEQLYTYEGDR